MVRLIDCLSNPDMKTTYNSPLNIEDIKTEPDEDSDYGRRNNYYSTSDEEYSIRGKKRKKKSRKNKSPGLKTLKPKIKEVVRPDNVVLWNGVDEPQIKIEEGLNNLQSFSEICCNADPLEIKEEKDTNEQSQYSYKNEPSFELKEEIESADDTGQRTEMLQMNTFYQQFYAKTGEQSDGSNLEDIPTSPQSSSSQKTNPSKPKDRKHKHKDSCHKSKKGRTENSKLKDLLSRNKSLPQDPLQASTNLSVYNNNISSNDEFKVNNINDLFLSNINAPEYEVELETTPIDHLTKQDQITVLKVESTNSYNRYSPPIKQEITLESKTDNKVINIDIDNLKAIKEKMFTSDTGSNFIEIVHSQPYEETFPPPGPKVAQTFKNTSPKRNYLASVTNSSDGSRSEPRIEITSTFCTAGDGDSMIRSNESTPVKSFLCDPTNPYPVLRRKQCT